MSLKSKMKAATKYSHIVDSKIQGIPCKLGIISFGYYQESYTRGHPDDWQESDFEMPDYEILDRKGYKAKWLGDKIKKSDETTILEDIAKYEKLLKAW